MKLRQGDHGRFILTKEVYEYLLKNPEKEILDREGKPILFFDGDSPLYLATYWCGAGWRIQDCSVLDGDYNIGPLEDYDLEEARYVLAVFAEQFKPNDKELPDD